MPPPRQVHTGERRTFRSTLLNQDANGVWVRLYTGQEVEVVAEHPYQEDAEEYLVRVLAADGTSFDAWETELLPGATSHYVTPDGRYVLNPEWVERRTARANV